MSLKYLIVKKSYCHLYLVAAGVHRVEAGGGGGQAGQLQAHVGGAPGHGRIQDEVVTCNSAHGTSHICNM